jgi:tripartite-type tricarboxylate transporter receptor subunit TctC
MTEISKRKVLAGMVHELFDLAGGHTTVGGDEADISALLRVRQRHSLPRAHNDGRPHRRQFLHLAAGAAALPALSRVALAQAYPTRPVRIIVGFPPGFLADIAPRLIAQSLSDSLRQQFVVENRPGASSNIATDAVVRAPPDGYSLLLVTQTNATNATLYENLSFNFIRDIAPVACIGTYPFVMVVRPSVPAKTVPEFMDYAKANPAKVNMSSPGTGSAGHIFGELFKIMTGVHIVHVPYRASFIPDLLSG